MLHPARPTVAVFSSGIRNLQYLATFLDAGAVVFRPRNASSIDAVVGWGNKGTAEPARRFAGVNEKPYWRLEDGFLRSVASGPRRAPLSLIVDDLGVYYDARGPSRLEHWLAHADYPGALLARAKWCLERVVSARLSKYNDQSVHYPPALERFGRDYVLVVDQTLGDASVEGGLATAASFEEMLNAALAEHPDAQILVKTHPDVLAGRKRGYLTRVPVSPRVTVVADSVHPHALLERALAVYVCTSQLGFEALLLERPVHCFGVPFYAGWGLTTDRRQLPPDALERRSTRRSLLELCAAAWLLYPRYVHPVRGERCEAEEVIDHLGLQRRRFAENAGPSRAYGFALWKRRYLRRYLSSPDGVVTFGGSPKEEKSERAVFWGDGAPRELARARASGRAVSFVEDGFLRSVGLGSDLTAPSSWVFDDWGLHYDPAQPSRLEALLAERVFDDAELGRAASLRRAIVDGALSKYNPSATTAVSWSAPAGRSVSLVIGQVEDDASVRLGGAGIHDNSALLEAVRKRRPDAFLVYKPHPDVLSGNRRGALSPDARELVDHVEEKASLPACLGACDEVHTLTSLVGFEALLRGLPVFCYGQPFYAGWGLTTDRVALPRRSRRLGLDELVAGTLIEYPRYYSFRIGAFVTAEDTVHELLKARAASADLSANAPRLERQLRRLGRWLWEATHAG